MQNTHTHTHTQVNTLNEEKMPSTIEQDRVEKNNHLCAVSGRIRKNSYDHSETVVEQNVSYNSH